jgi:hypothetical protein
MSTSFDRSSLAAGIETLGAMMEAGPLKWGE